MLLLKKKMRYFRWFDACLSMIDTNYGNIKIIFFSTILGIVEANRKSIDNKIEK